MTRSAEKWPVPIRTWPNGGLRLVTDKTKKTTARLRTPQPTAARFKKKSTARLRTAPRPQAARLNKKINLV